MKSSFNVKEVKEMKKILRKQKGFTLIELLLVVIVLGILAALAIPQFTDASKDTKESSLKQDLSLMRDSVERYYHQHSNNYPGQVDVTGTGAPADAAAAAAAMIAQLSQYTDKTGKTSATLDRVNYPYGPYLKVGMPVNPLPGTTAGTPINTVTADITSAVAITADASPTTGWKFATKTGQLIANNTTYQSW